MIRLVICPKRDNTSKQHECPHDGMLNMIPISSHPDGGGAASYEDDENDADKECDLLGTALFYTADGYAGAKSNAPL